jgi:hypothetical protein
MSITNLNAGGYKQIAATANVSPIPATLLGIFVSAATTTPTITVYDDAGTGTTTKMVDTFTPTAGTWYQIPASASKGIYMVFSGTVSATVVFA